MRFVEWANAHSKDQLAFEGLLLIVNRGPFTPAAEAAAAVLAKHYLDVEGSKFQPISTALVGTPPAVAEHSLRAWVEKSPVRATRGKACWSLGMYKAQVLFWAKMLEDGPPLSLLLDEEMVPHLRELDHERTFADAESLLNQAMTEYGDIEIKISSDGKTMKMAELAKRDLNRISQEFQSLAIGQVGPEIDGKTLDGKHLKLADYRGKVVVLTFWSTGCVPCILMIPEEKALVDKYRDRPFALLAVNTDQDREKAKAVIAKYEMTWPSWWDGAGEVRAISDMWVVNLLPTVYVLDHKGVIRFKHLRGERLLEAIDSLLAEISKDSQ
jgi:thiol-disulfide isomerase/thioredoxin